MNEYYAALELQEEMDQMAEETIRRTLMLDNVMITSDNP